MIIRPFDTPRGTLHGRKQPAKLTVSEWLSVADSEDYPAPHIHDYGGYDPNERVTLHEYNRRILEMKISHG